MEEGEAHKGHVSGPVQEITGLSPARDSKKDAGCLPELSLEGRRRGHLSPSFQSPLAGSPPEVLTPHTQNCTCVWTEPSYG